MNVPNTYLDHNATAPLRPCARAAMLNALDLGGNPSSVHGAGRRARAVVEDARERIAIAVDAAPRQVVFTAGGTEANHLALRGVAAKRILVSAVEHDSVLAAADAGNGARVVLPVDRDGVLDLDALEDALRAEDGPALVSVMLANNETGVIQPVAEAAALAHRHGALIHCDAAQGLGRIPVSFAGLGVDLLTLSAHKIGGAPGAGAVIVGDGVALAPLLTGGGQEMGLRAGTENVAGIAGFGAAVAAAGAERSAGGDTRLAALRDALEAGLYCAAPEAVVVGANVARLPNTSCIALPGRPAELQVIALDLAGVAISAGSACSSGKVRRSHVLGAMGHGDAIAGCAIRVSLGWNSEPADVGRFLDAWAAMRVRAAERADLVPA
jgi:cysteine desulfurase